MKSRRLPARKENPKTNLTCCAIGSICNPVGVHDLPKSATCPAKSKTTAKSKSKTKTKAKASSKTKEPRVAASPTKPSEATVAPTSTGAANSVAIWKEGVGVLGAAVVGAVALM